MSLHKKYFYIIYIILLSVLLLSGCSFFEQQPAATGFINGRLALSEQQQELLNPLYFSENELPGAVRGAVSPSPAFPASTRQSENKSANNYVLKLKEPLPEAEIKQLLSASGASLEKKISTTTYLLRFSSQEKEAREQLSSRPTVSYLEPDYPVLPQSAVPPDDPLYAKQWHLQQLNLETVWEQGYRGSSQVTVAVIDTGIVDHEDLEENLSYREGNIYGYDLITDDHHPLDTGPHFKHGTHVAGIIAASTNNNTGISGINWQLDLLPVRVIGPEGGTTTTLASGIKWAADNGADIINLSLAALNTDSEPQILKEAVQYAADRDVIMVGASGNDGYSSVSYPARFPEVISVGALDYHGRRAYFSNYGPALDLMAPGVDIISTTGDNGYHPSSGTSMAAPQVTGLVALLYAEGNTDPQQIKKLLRETADSRSSSNEYGAGMVNFTRALGIENRETRHTESAPGLTTDEPGTLPLKLKAESLNSSQTEVLPLQPDDDNYFLAELPAGDWQITILLDKNSNDRTPENSYRHTIEKISLEEKQTVDLGTITLE